jgi:hypothetical protein
MVEALGQQRIAGLAYNPKIFNDLKIAKTICCESLTGPFRPL